MISNYGNTKAENFLHLPDAVEEDEEGGGLSIASCGRERRSAAARLEGVTSMQPLALDESLEPANRTAHCEHC